MKYINRINEFILNKESIISLIEEVERTNLSDLEAIANKESYKKVVSLGNKVVPILLERNLVIWDIALKRITGDGLDNLSYSSSERSEFWKNGQNQMDSNKEIEYWFPNIVGKSYKILDHLKFD